MKNSIFICKTPNDIKNILKKNKCKNYEEYQYLHAKNELPKDTFLGHTIPKIDKLYLKIDLTKYKKKKDPEYVFNNIYGLMKKFYLEKNFISITDFFNNYYITKENLLGHLIYSYNYYKCEYINTRIIFGINDIGFYATMQDESLLNKRKIIPWHLFGGYSGLPSTDWHTYFIEIK